MGIVIEGAQGAMHFGRKADRVRRVANTVGIGIGTVLAARVARRLGAAARGVASEKT